jgi:hypothetical protein
VLIVLRNDSPEGRISFFVLNEFSALLAFGIEHAEPIHGVGQ